jgi:helicase required for RNAi-mediated heterochromatin assembly 1
MLALSPMNDGFGSICKVAIVAARPVVGGLDQNPPQVDLYWGNVDDLALDPSECKNSHFQAVSFA